MNEREYTLAQDLTRIRIARDVINEIVSPSLQVQQVRVALDKLIERGYRALDKVMEEE